MLVNLISLESLECFQCYIKLRPRFRALIVNTANSELISMSLNTSNNVLLFFSNTLKFKRQIEEVL